jgi:hypothetical protein
MMTTNGYARGSVRAGSARTSDSILSAFFSPARAMRAGPFIPGGTTHTATRRRWPGGFRFNFSILSFSLSIGLFVLANAVLLLAPLLQALAAAVSVE